jgi:hypothetical protein
LLDILQSLDSTNVFQDQFQEAEIILLTSDSPSQLIAKHFQQANEVEEPSFKSEYEFLSNLNLKQMRPITCLGQLTEYILYYYIRRLFLSNGLEVEPNDPDKVIGQSVSVVRAKNAKISSQVFGWNWLKARLTQLKIENSVIFDDAKWSFDAKQIEMNFRAELRTLNENEIIVSDFPFKGKTFEVFQFVHDDNGAIRLERVDNPLIYAGFASIEFYSEDSLTSENKAKKIDEKILEKLLQILKSATVSVAEEFYISKLYDPENTLQERRNDKTLSVEQFNQEVASETLEWDASIVGFAAICIASKLADFEDPKTIERSARMISIIPELMDLVESHKFYILHFPQNLRDILMDHKEVRISEKFNKGFVDFVEKETIEMRLRMLEEHSQQTQMRLSMIAVQIQQLTEAVKDSQTFLIVKLFWKSMNFITLIFEFWIAVFVWIFSRQRLNNK